MVNVVIVLIRGVMLHDRVIVYELCVKTLLSNVLSYIMYVFVMLIGKFVGSISCGKHVLWLLPRGVFSRPHHFRSHDYLGQSD